MEWAIGKGYDLYRPDSGKLILPGSRISWDVHIHAVGEEIRDNVELGIWLYPKGQEPKHRSYLTGFQALRSFQPGVNPRARAGKNIDLAPNSISQTDNYTVLERPAQLGLESEGANPARGFVALRIGLPDAAPVTLGVFDLAGRELARLAEGTYPAGWHRVTWNGSGRDGRPVPNGVYLVRLVSGATRRAVQVVLLR